MATELTGKGCGSWWVFSPWRSCTAESHKDVLYLTPHGLPVLPVPATVLLGEEQTPTPSPSVLSVMGFRSLVR